MNNNGEQGAEVQTVTLEKKFTETRLELHRARCSCGWLGLWHDSERTRWTFWDAAITHLGSASHARRARVA